MKQTRSHSEKEKFWHQQMSMANKFSGSHRAFCKAQGISVHSFAYWRQKFERQRKQVKSLVPSPFVQLVVEKPMPVLRNQPLPEAAWVAELILHLQMGLR